VWHQNQWKSTRKTYKVSYIHDCLRCTVACSQIQGIQKHVANLSVR
jgi:hypothetical protein